MLEKLKKLLQTKEEERAAMVERSQNSEDIVELRSINGQLERINHEIGELRSMIQEAEQPKVEEDPVAERTKVVTADEDIEQRSYIPGAGFNSLAIADLNKREQNEEQDYEARGKDLLEKRTITLGASKVIAPQHQANDIKGTFSQVSTLVDGVTIKPLIGGESYKRPYVKGYGTGGNTAEGAAATEAEVQFGYADMNKAKITAYAEDTEEVEKLPAAAYAQEVEKGVRIAIRKKLAAEILTGDGTTNHLMGIFNSESIEASTDLDVKEITNTTLDDIIFSYGGDEDIEDAAVLILNKKDLKAFSQLRSSDGKKVHTIIANGNTGTIDGIPYLINSNCKAVSDSTTTDGQYCMAYGPLSNYELAIFGDLEVKKSSDYKFKEGMIAHRAVEFVGGNVAAHNGFLRIKKKVEM
ncbi:MAG: phage major capsid protein [Clostridiales bacterium]|uniref:phage major capsid protein n=1 Tax=Zhenhengia sp. TaxID=2944208 RepID=UPI0029084561|nr:phage major capsid protein [Clostridiales bacterium]